MPQERNQPGGRTGKNEHLFPRKLKKIRRRFTHHMKAHRVRIPVIMTEMLNGLDFPRRRQLSFFVVDWGSVKKDALSHREVTCTFWRGPCRYHFNHNRFKKYLKDRKKNCKYLHRLSS